MKVKTGDVHLCDGGGHPPPSGGVGSCYGAVAMRTSGAQTLLCILFWVVLTWRWM